MLPPWVRTFGQAVPRLVAFQSTSEADAEALRQNARRSGGKIDSRGLEVSVITNSIDQLPGENGPFSN
ncbi:hypothetical protein DTL21_07930 [Bremerella cremea]|uniref:Uncharacterized protein n=1 Tax=Blastopirellula marina TaxID=124 RepID=A0A2S8FUK8_9BACT|nr:hypothetical protein C5Y83_07925 [Blastopirellula marina]RCS48532.1 hypothetical protein DTL21_07930 [Bremerella cremea]